MDWLSILKPKPVRTATYVVAASDASDLEKYQADRLCDGVGDNEEIQWALDALSGAGLKGVVRLTGGNYYFTAPDLATTLLIEVPSGCELEGELGATFFNFSGSSTAPWEVITLGSNSTPVEDVVIKNIIGIGDGDPGGDDDDSGGTLLRVNHASHVLVENCHVRNVKNDGFHVSDHTAPWGNDIKFKNCSVNGWGLNYTNRTAFGCDDAHRDVTFEDCLATNLISPSAVFLDDGGEYTDYTSAALNITTGDIKLMPDAPAVNDALYIGCASKFFRLFTNVSQAGAGTYTITWEYYDSSTGWTELPVTETGQAGQFTVYGKFGLANWNLLYWPNVATWAEVEVNGTTAYFIRGRISAFTNMTTQPLASQIYLHQAQSGDIGFGISLFDNSQYEFERNIKHTRCLAEGCWVGFAWGNTKSVGSVTVRQKGCSATDCDARLFIRFGFRFYYQDGLMWNHIRAYDGFGAGIDGPVANDLNPSSQNIKISASISRIGYSGYCNEAYGCAIIPYSSGPIRNLDLDIDTQAVGWSGVFLGNIDGCLLKANLYQSGVQAGSYSGLRLASMDNLKYYAGKITQTLGNGRGIEYTDLNSTDNIIDGIDLTDCTVPVYGTVPSGTKFIACPGYLAPGEIRTWSGSLVAGAVGEAVIAWQNPEAQAMMVTGRTRITTGATAAATGDWGKATTVQVVEDCEDVWTDGTHGTCAVNTTYVERGTNCVAVTIAEGITADDIVAYEDFNS